MFRVPPGYDLSMSDQSADGDHKAACHKALADLGLHIHPSALDGDDESFIKSVHGAAHAMKGVNARIVVPKSEEPEAAGDDQDRDGIQVEYHGPRQPNTQMLSTTSGRKRKKRLRVGGGFQLSTAELEELSRQFGEPSAAEMADIEARAAKFSTQKPSKWDKPAKAEGAELSSAAEGIDSEEDWIAERARRQSNPEAK